MLSSEEATHDALSGATIDDGGGSVHAAACKLLARLGVLVLIVNLGDKLVEDDSELLLSLGSMPMIAWASRAMALCRLPALMWARAYSIFCPMVHSKRAMSLVAHA